jgi:hypothetical protein
MKNVDEEFCEFFQVQNGKLIEIDLSNCLKDFLHLAERNIRNLK